jgi:hypothetical protein
MLGTQLGQVNRLPERRTKAVKRTTSQSSASGEEACASLRAPYAQHYCSATTSISISASLGKAATWTVERDGGSFLKNCP